MTIKSNIILLSVLVFCGCGQFASVGTKGTDSDADALINRGEFAKATQVLKNRMATESLSISELYDLHFKIDRMKRIREDFDMNRDTAIAYIQKYYPDVTDAEISKWEKTGALECMTIDGEKKYFYNAPRNLFRINKEAQRHWYSANGRQSNELDLFLEKYIPKAVSDSAKSKQIYNIGQSEFCHYTAPVKMHIKYTITVDPGEVPAGEIIRVWMPYPRENERYKEIKLISVSQPEYLISPKSYLHQSLYMEQVAKAGKPAIFSYELSFISYNKWFSFGPQDIKSYNKQSNLYKEFTAERKSHVIFSEKIKHLTDSITGNEQNPYLRAKKIFCYIADNYPWASAREYSTIENIPQYVIDNHHGDCGQVSLLFITMARYAGIPAKWQSGWMLHPGEVNLHDWAEAYFEGIGWVPVDQSFGYVKSNNQDTKLFFTKGLDAYRYIVNEDFSQDLYPAKIYPRSETVDFQRGEVEWKGENLYFNRWHYNMEVKYE
jgi:hypothetical protein